MQEDIIRMAREAGLPIFDCAAVADNPHEQAMADIVTKYWHDSARRFAQLVAEKCAYIADTAEPYKSADLIRKHFGINGEA